MSTTTKTKAPGDRKKRGVKQRATIILEDTKDGRMTCRIEYDPEVSAEGPVTSTAVRASLGILKFLAEHGKKS